LEFPSCGGVAFGEQVLHRLDHRVGRVFHCVCRATFLYVDEIFYIIIL
jgi:hypothetical protein